MRHQHHITVATLFASAFFTVAGSAIAAEVFQRPEPAVGHSYPDYYCTNRGVRVNVDRTACLTVDGKTFEAKCDISLNNPMWRPTGNSCEPVVTTEIHAGGSD